MSGSGESPGRVRRRRERSDPGESADFDDVESVLDTGKRVRQADNTQEKEVGTRLSSFRTHDFSRLAKVSAAESKRFSFVSRAVHAVHPQKLQEQESVLCDVGAFSVGETLEELGEDAVRLEEEGVGEVADRANAGSVE